MDRCLSIEKLYQRALPVAPNSVTSRSGPAKVKAPASATKTRSCAHAVPAVALVIKTKRSGQEVEAVDSTTKEAMYGAEVPVQDLTLEAKIPHHGRQARDSILKVVM